MNHPSATSSVGERVRAIRLRRGMSQRVLGELIGQTRSSIANYETGERPVDSRALLLDLAGALRVDVTDLTGHEQDRLDPTTAAFHAIVPDVETVLFTRGNVTDQQTPRSLAELATLAERVTLLRHNCDYVAIGPMLAPMLTDAYRHVHDTGTNRAWDVLATVTYGVASALRARGYHPLAWIAAQETARAAEHVDSAAQQAAAAFSQAQIMLSRPGALPAALALTTRTAEQIADDVRTVGEVETAGMLHLQGSLVASIMGGDPRPHLDEAGEQVARLATAAPTVGTARNESFGAANLALWRMSAAMERGEAGEVLELAPTLRVAELPNDGRRAQYFVEIGRAHAAKKDYQSSLHSLLRAELAAPQHVRSMTLVQELAGFMMRRASKSLTAGDLGRFAQRVGAVPV